jgi:ATP-dependent exoDNAse (exonuclease V) alpha subunit
MEMQDKYKDNLRLIILDEYSMLHQKQLYYMDNRLKQIMCSTEPFGGVTIVLTGDPGQLPPVGSNSLWIRKASNANPHDLAGYGLYQLFRTVIKLEENVRIDPNDPDAVLFNGFQIRLRDGLNTPDGDLLLVREKCSRHSMGLQEWKNRGFDDPNVPHLFCTNVEVNDHNARCITALGKPIAWVCASHTGRGKSAKSKQARGLADQMYLAVGAKVQMTWNIATYAGLCNGSTGIVKDIVYSEGVQAPSLPRFVIVDFGDQYMGESFFPDNPERRGWVPIKPVTCTWVTRGKANGDQYDEHSRTMLPLVTAWAFTVWKSQGQTFIGKVVLHLTEREREHGLTYVAFSRATRFSNIGLYDGISESRLIAKVRNHSKMGARIQHERVLHQLSLSTREWMSTE